jgi:hypothetical protein
MLLAPHPYARPVTGSAETVTPISAGELRDHHRTFYQPANATLAIAGDVAVEEAFAAAAEAFAGGQAADSAEVRVRAPQPADTTRVRIVDHPGLERAVLRVGHLAPPRRDEDHLPVLVLNGLLGVSAAAGGARGLPADSRSTFVHLLDSGVFYLAASCRPDEAADAVRALRETLERARAQAPAAQEVERVKRQLEQTWPLALETRAAWAGQWLTADFYGMPPDHLQSFRSRLRAVTAEQVHRAARRRLDPRHLAVVAVGPGAALREALSGLGPTELVDFLAEPAAFSLLGSGPEGPAPESEARGRALVDRALQSHGGAEALRGVAASEAWGRIVLLGTGSGVTGRVHQVRKEPYKMRLELDFPAFGSVSSVQALDGWGGWVQKSDSLAWADSITVRGMRKGFISDPTHLLLLAASPSGRTRYLGREEFFGQPADVLAVSDPVGGHQVRLYLDPESGRLAGSAHEEATVAGRATLARRYREYKTVAGVLCHTYEQQYINGAPAVSYTYSDVRLNGAVSDTLFMRPVRRPR